MLENIRQTSNYLKSKIEEIPNTAIILGTGLGELVHEIDNKQIIPYTEIPNFPVSTVEGQMCIRDSPGPSCSTSSAARGPS